MDSRDAERHGVAGKARSGFGPVMRCRDRSRVSWRPRLRAYYDGAMMALSAVVKFWKRMNESSMSRRRKRNSVNRDELCGTPALAYNIMTQNNAKHGKQMKLSIPERVTITPKDGGATDWVQGVPWPRDGIKCARRPKREWIETSNRVESRDTVD